MKPLRVSWGLCFFLSLVACATTDPIVPSTNNDLQLNIEQANRLAALPMKCLQQPYPYKSGHVVHSAADEGSHIDHHPAFYGCFDWHSAVHGHWSLVYLLKTFPQLAVAQPARRALGENLSAANILREIDYFSMNAGTQSFERTYGWAWLLKLQLELESWDDPEAKQWADNLRPLARLISQKYIDYLPKLGFPIRSGQHPNTAFGLGFAWDYAIALDDQPLANAIERAARRLFIQDKNCPVQWEPSGYDFLSPCLEQARLMKKILEPADYAKWVGAFIPGGERLREALSPVDVSDRSDGKLVHLDGLNFARSWCLYTIDRDVADRQLADDHLRHSLPKIADGDYAGEHWLASFALYALQERDQLPAK